jgi:DNA-binding NarL/FixJ family response regulator
VVIVDIALPGRDGLELIKDLQALHSTCLCIVLSMFEETLYAERALRAGAHGYVMKHEPPENLIQAIHQVLAGNIVAGAVILIVPAAFLEHPRRGLLGRR